MLAYPILCVRNDSDTLNKKGCEVNAILTELYKEKNISRQYKEN